MPAGGRSVRRSPFSSSDRIRASTRHRSGREEPGRASTSGPENGGGRLRAIYVADGIGGNLQPEPKAFEQRPVDVWRRIWRRQQTIAEKHRVGPGEKAERLGFVRERE